MADRPYPNGLPQALTPPPDVIDGNANLGDDPSFASTDWEAMSKRWEPVLTCIGGTAAFRENAKTYLPQEPAEDEQAWGRRKSHSTLSPFMTRIADQAAGLICRKPVQLEPLEPEGTLDPFWDEFTIDVDGYGTHLDSFARALVLDSILLGHSAILVDYSATEPAQNLQEERDRGDRPYFIPVRANQILGHRVAGQSPISPISQIRIEEYVSEPVGLFGDRRVKQVRELYPGGWRVWRKPVDQWIVVKDGMTSLDYIPLAVTYSNKVSELVSKPPLLAVSYLNLLHSQRNADLQFSLHVSAMPILTLAGYDDGNNEIGLSASSAILLPPEGRAEYVEPASSSFKAQQEYLTELENQMRSLGISTLFQQSFAAETATSKAMDRTDSDSLLSIIAQDLQNCLQNAFDTVADFAKVPKCKVIVSSDFNLQQLTSEQVNSYMSMWAQGLITHQTTLEMLVRGEVLPSLDVEKEIEAVEASKLDYLDINEAGGVPVDEEAGDVLEEEEEDSDLKKEVIKRLKEKAEREDQSQD